MNNYVKTIVNQMSRRTDTVITPRHDQILEFAYDYYVTNKVGPLFHVLKKRIGVTKEELNKLFPNGLLSVYTWVGIPIQSGSEPPCKPLAKINVDKFKEVYFDYNATTFVRDEVKKVLVDYYNGKYGYGNPSSSTAIGEKAYEQLFAARRNIAATLNVHPNEIFFTGCGSESNNLAIKGIAFNHLEKKGHIITTKIEHSSVLQTMEWLESIGFEVTYLDVDSEGLISVDELKKAIKSNTILIAVMYANNEIGIINPIHEIGEIAAHYKIPFLSDAIQAYGKLPISPKKSGISMLSFSGHKIYAPKGIGAIFVDEKTKLTPLIHGGGQESGLRAGTENVAFIMALSKAAELMHEEMFSETKRLTDFRNEFLKRLAKVVPDYKLNGSLTKRLYNNLNIGFPGVDGGAIQLSLNNIGVYASSQSACSSGSKETSHVIKALGVDGDKYGVMRLSFGLKSKEEDLNYFFKYLPEILKQLRENEK
jgi:cysteine desulfurase